MATYGANIKIGANISDFDKKMKKVQREIRKTGRTISDVGKKMTQGLTVPILAGATAIGLMVSKAVQTGDELKRMSDITGISVEELQRMKFVGSQLGVELETMTTSQKRLTRAVAEAHGGNKEQIKSFEQLGISIYDTNGNLKDANSIFNEVIDKLGDIEDPILRDALAMDLMGKSAMDLNPLIKAGSSEIERLKNRADELGIVMSKEGVESLDAFDDAMDEMNKKIEAGGMSISIALLPVLERLLEILDELIPPIVKFFTSLAEGFAKLPTPAQDFILLMIGLLAILGPILMTIGWLIVTFAPLIAWLGKTAFAFKILGIAVNLSIGWVLLIIVGLIAAIYLLWTNWDKITKWMGDAFAWLGEGVGKVWEGIVDGIEAGINMIIGMINLLIKGINLIPGVKFPLIPKVDFNGNGKDLFGNFNSEKNQTTNVNVNLDGKKISSYTDNSIGGRSIAQGGAY